MKTLSENYKLALNSPLRKRGYARVYIGVVNTDAQNVAEESGTTITREEWSNGNIIGVGNTETYATLDKNYLRADGTAHLLSKYQEEDYLQTGFVSEPMTGGTKYIRIVFDKAYKMNGLSITFQKDSYLKSFRIETVYDGITYNTYVSNNNTENWFTRDYLGMAEEIRIYPTTHGNGSNLSRVRISNILMGYGEMYENDRIASVSLEADASPISVELPSQKLSVDVFDTDDWFNLDNPNTYYDYLSVGQSVKYFCGMETDSGIEWVQMCDLYLTSWKSTHKKASFVAQDMFALDVWEEKLGEITYGTKTFKPNDPISVSDFVYVLKGHYSDAFYKLDVNSIFDASHVSQNNIVVEENTTLKQALQMLANYSLCVIKMLPSGYVFFDNLYANKTPSQFSTLNYPRRTYSKCDQLLSDRQYAYTDLALNHIQVGSSDNEYGVIFPGVQKNYTGYASQEVADADGDFTATQKLGFTTGNFTTLTLNIDFEQAVKTLVVKTYDNNTPESGNIVEQFEFSDVAKEFTFTYPFKTFKSIVLEFPNNYPNMRVYVKKISFNTRGATEITKDNILDYITVSQEDRIGKIEVYYYTYDSASETLKEAETPVTIDMECSGSVMTLQNSLIPSEGAAESVARWLALNSKESVVYTGTLRGMPNIDASDYISIQNDYGYREAFLNKSKFTFNGAFRQTIEAVRKGEAE